MRRPRSRAAILSILVVGAIIFGVVLYGWNRASDIFTPVSSSQKTVEIRVQPGETSGEIAQELQDKGIIRSALAFNIWARVKGLDKKLEAGVYNKISPNMSISDIIDNLQTGQPDEILVLVKEGKRLEELPKVITSQVTLPNFKADEFVTYTKQVKNFPDAKNYPMLSSVPANNSLEGFLFPDTYAFSKQATAREVINKMLGEMEDKITQNHLEQQAKDHGMSIYQFVTLASLVQREAGVRDKAEGKANIASVYWNRIYTDHGQNEAHGLLQADPTVQYARDSEEKPAKYWEPLADKGINIAPQSAWNTYFVKGLPPTPICSPGLESLKAGANPPKTTFVYFFAAASDGLTHFQSTNTEFDAERLKLGVLQ